MQILFEFLKKYYYWFLLLVMETICFILLFQFNNYQGSVWFTAANSVAGTINGFYSEAISYIGLKNTNARLTRENVYLQKQVADLREILDMSKAIPNANDRIIADSLKGYRLIPARVISNSLNKKNNIIVINKGSEDGVCEDMGVVGGGGIVGIVYLTGTHYSLVLPSINTSSNISCRVRHSNYFGTLQWAGKSANMAELTDIPHYAKIKVGDYIETSGFSTVFPPGLFVGKVKKISNASDGLSLLLTVNLGTDFARLTDVMVIENPHRQPILTLQQKMEEKSN